MSSTRQSKMAMEDFVYKLGILSSSLNGLGSLFQFQSQQSSLEPREFAGIGDLLQLIAEELGDLNETLDKNSINNE
jgi:hypothetical protein